MKIRIVEGTYKIRGRDTSLAGMVFELVEHFKVGARGGYVTVDGRSVAGFPERAIRVAVPSADAYEAVGDEVKTTEVEETDEQIIERLKDRFEMLEDMTKAVKRGDVRALIVSGPPGVGKSYGVERVLDQTDSSNSLMKALTGSDKEHVKYEMFKGTMSALGLYCNLYKYSGPRNVVVFDDCDSIFSDELSLNILKAALDSKRERTIHWNTDSYKLQNEGVPNKFSFKGSAIFITNLKFSKARGKIREHLEALESRCHYIDLTIDTDREKMLRIKQLIGEGMLDEYDLSEEAVQEVVDFVDVNKTKLRELSLRTLIKAAQLRKTFGDRWEAAAENTLLRRG